MELAFFCPTNHESLAAFWVCSTNKITKTSIYIFKKNLKNSFLAFFFFLVFTEEIAFKYFQFINITKFRFFLFLCDHADIKKWKSFKEYDVYIIIIFRIAGPNLDLLCVRQSDTLPINEIYAKLYFQAKHLKRDSMGGGKIFDALFFLKKPPFRQISDAAQNF